MSDLQSQITLLNDYIRTLERQNQSKTNQIRTLTEQNNQLIQQCEQLRSKSRQSVTTVISSSSTSSTSQLQQTIQKLQGQLKQSKAAYTLLFEQSQQGSEVQSLRQSVRRLTEQKLILQQYKQKLEKQLREIGFKSTDTYISKMKELQYTIEDYSKRVKTYEGKIVDYERRVTLLSNQITIKSSQIQRLNDKVRSVTETSYNSRSTETTKITSYETRINQYQSRANQYQTRIDQYQSKITQLSSQITFQKSEIQRLKEKQSQLVISIRDNQTLKRQIQNLNARILSLNGNSTQISSYQLTINTLQTEKKDWERQRQQLQIKISDQQTEIVEKSNTIAQLRLREEYLQNKESTQSTKNTQIQNLNSTIRSLRVQIEDHKRTISYRDSTIKTLQGNIRTLQGNIKSLQSKMSSYDYSKSSQILSIQRIVQEKNAQINRLIQAHNQKITQLTLQIERYKSISIINSQTTNELNSLKDENAFLKRESQNNQLLIQQLQREKESLKFRIRDLQELLSKSRNSVSQVKTFIKNDSSQTQLTRIVRQLRSQLDEVKKSNLVIHEQNHQMQRYLSELTQSQMQIPYFGNQPSIIRYHSPQNITSFHNEVNSPSELRLNMQNESFLKKSKHYQQPYFKSQMNIEKKKMMRNYNERSNISMSPVRDTKQIDPSAHKKQKWESLQRKISALRVQNDELKKALLYD